MANPLTLINKKVNYDEVCAKTSTGIYTCPSVPYFWIKPHNANPVHSTACPHKYHRQIKLNVILSQPLQYFSCPHVTTSTFMLSTNNNFNIPVILIQPLQYSSSPNTTTSVFPPLTTTSIFQLSSHNHFSILVLLTQPLQYSLLSQPLQYSSYPLTTTSIFQLSSEPLQYST
jgi:hypothetical protein